MKGTWKTLESIIAGVIILLFVAGLGATRIQYPSQEPVHGSKALQAIYEDGSLHKPAADLNCSHVETLIRNTGYVSGYETTVRICSYNGTCCGLLPADENIYATTVILTGENSFSPYEVILYIH